MHMMSAARRAQSWAGPREAPNQNQVLTPPVGLQVPGLSFPVVPSQSLFRSASPSIPAQVRGRSAGPLPETTEDAEVARCRWQLVLVDRAIKEWDSAKTAISVNTAFEVVNQSCSRPGHWGTEEVRRFGEHLLASLGLSEAPVSEESWAQLGGFQWAEGTGSFQALRKEPPEPRGRSREVDRGFAFAVGRKLLQLSHEEMELQLKRGEAAALGAAAALQLRRHTAHSQSSSDVQLTAAPLVQQMGQAPCFTSPSTSVKTEPLRISSGAIQSQQPALTPRVLASSLVRPPTTVFVRHSSPGRPQHPFIMEPAARLRPPLHQPGAPPLLPAVSFSAAAPAQKTPGQPAVSPLQPAVSPGHPAAMPRFHFGQQAVITEPQRLSAVPRLKASPRRAPGPVELVAARPEASNLEKELKALQQDLAVERAQREALAARVDALLRSRAQDTGERGAPSTNGHSISSCPRGLEDSVFAHEEPEPSAVLVDPDGCETSPLADLAGRHRYPGEEAYQDPGQPLARSLDFQPHATSAWSASDKVNPLRRPGDEASSGRQSQQEAEEQEPPAEDPGGLSFYRRKCRQLASEVLRKDTEVIQLRRALNEVRTRDEDPRQEPGT